MVVVRAGQQHDAAARLSTGSTFGLAAPSEEGAAKLLTLFRREASELGFGIKRDREGQWVTSPFTHEREYWVYGRVVTGNGREFTRPLQATGAEVRHADVA